MTVLERFPGITQANVPLAPFTHLRVGGPAEFLVQPRTPAELADLLTFGKQTNTPVRILGGGVNLVVRDEPLRGVVVRLVEPAFTDIRVDGRRVRAGCGAKLDALIAAAARHDLTGFESLVGIPATVGGALRYNAGDRSGDIGQFVRRVDVMDAKGEVTTRERDDLKFGERSSNLDDAVLLAADFELDLDRPEAIVKRMRKAWIQRRAVEPFPFEPAARAFQNSRGQSASALIEQAGMARAKIGAAELSERNANYVVARPGATARDVLQLLDQVKSKVLETTGVTLLPELVAW